MNIDIAKTYRLAPDAVLLLDKRANVWLRVDGRGDCYVGGGPYDGSEVTYRVVRDMRGPLGDAVLAAFRARDERARKRAFREIGKIDLVGHGLDLEGDEAAAWLAREMQWEAA